MHHTVTRECVSCSLGCFTPFPLPPSLTCVAAAAPNGWLRSVSDSCTSAHEAAEEKCVPPPSQHLSLSLSAFQKKGRKKRGGRRRRRSANTKTPSEKSRDREKRKGGVNEREAGHASRPSNKPQKKGRECNSRPCLGFFFSSLLDSPSSSSYVHSCSSEGGCYCVGPLGLSEEEEEEPACASFA